MHRPAVCRLSPWIESLILSYGSREGSSNGERLKAHVIGVGPMSQYQTPDSTGPTVLLFLSDGGLQISAILTASAWEHLQEQEDRESFTSLTNTTVSIQDYQLLFHMDPEMTKCRFYLSVGELSTTAAGPVKDNTPCCTTLPSVQLKICQTWRALQGQRTQHSQNSQCVFDLTELLGEWQFDCVKTIMDDVQERLTTVSRRPASPQPSTSTDASSLTYPDTFTATSWDVNRVTYKGAKSFSVPVKCLLIPTDVGSRTPSGLCGASGDRKRALPQVCRSSETAQPSVDDAEWRVAKLAVVEMDRGANESSPFPLEDRMPHEDMITGVIDSDIRLLSNPWDIFPPCDTTSLSDSSPEATPTHSPHSPTAAESRTDQAVLTSTQLTVHSSKGSLQTSENSKGEHSCLPPYQKPQHSTGLPTSSSTSASPPEPFTRPSNLLPATDQQNRPALDQENQILEKNMQETVERKHRKAKRKRSVPQTPTTSVEEEEEKAQISGSPPSWLFDSRAEEGSSQTQVQTAGTGLRKTPSVHTDGRPFSYSYQVSGQNLQDFSQAKVSESLLQWAVKYLVVPKQTDNPHNTPGTSTQTPSDRAEVTSL